MIRLAPNTAGQKIYTTAYQGRILLDESFSNYLILFYRGMGDTEYAFIGSVDSDNTRYTSFDIDTNSDDAVNGNILIPDAVNGYFHYIIYGQNSATNLDPMDATVVGEVERGLTYITDPNEQFTSVNTPEATFKVYDGN